MPLLILWEKIRLRVKEPTVSLQLQVHGTGICHLTIQSSTSLLDLQGLSLSVSPKEIREKMEIEECQNVNRRRSYIFVIAIYFD